MLLNESKAIFHTKYILSNGFDSLCTKESLEFFTRAMCYNTKSVYLLNCQRKLHQK